MKPNSLTVKRRRANEETKLQKYPTELSTQSTEPAINPALDWFNYEPYEINSENLECTKNNQLEFEKLNFFKLKVEGSLKQLQGSGNYIKELLKINQNQLQPINFQNNFKVKDDKFYSDLSYCKFANEYYFLKPIYSQQKIFKVPLLPYYNSKLSHENIVKSIGYTKINNQKYIILGYLPKTLYEYLNDNLNLKQRLGLILDIGRGLCFMHMKNTVLMNLSPWSVFVSPEGSAVLFDLDCCSNLNMDVQSEMTYKEEDFASPEALRGNRGFHCDVYSFGLMAYYILTNGPYSEYIGLDGIQEEFQDIIKLMLKNNPYERPNIEFCYKEFENIEQEFQNRWE